MAHKHDFTIPVEWEYIYDFKHGEEHEILYHPTKQFPPHRMRVTRLRCACGEETPREVSPVDAD